jgi:hypothetical protein
VGHEEALQTGKDCTFLGCVEAVKKGGGETSLDPGGELLYSPILMLYMES